MKVRVQKSGTVVVLDLEGRITIDENTDQLHEVVEEITSCGPQNVVLNLEKVGRLDCSGIGQLVELRKRVCDSGSMFTMVNIGPRQRKMLKLVGLLSVFEVPVQREEMVARHDSTLRGLRLAVAGTVRQSPRVARASVRNHLGNAV
jgi:anti-anti-sigma factor